MSLFSIRPAKDSDIPYLNSYAFNEGMDNMPGIEGIFVAVESNDIPVGFIRALKSPTQEGLIYINPIVTISTWRKHGVGKALMQSVEQHATEVRLVSRGNSIPFYNSLGYKPISMQDIEDIVGENCDECPMLAECNPQAMGKIVDIL